MVVASAMATMTSVAEAAAGVVASAVVAVAVVAVAVVGLVHCPPLLTPGPRSMTIFNVWFLDASLHLYKRVCPSVGPSVRPSVRGTVCHAFVKNAGFMYRNDPEGIQSHE